MVTRACRRCGSTFEAPPPAGRGQWPRFCSDACRDSAPPTRPAPGCGAEGCTKPARSSRARWCEMHYYRLRRRGSLDARPWHRRGDCALDGCTAAEDVFGYCGKHATRLRRHGDPNVVLTPVHWRGPDHASWLGDDAGYGAVHARLVVRFGPAREHLCVECAGPAAHWSYDREDPFEKSSARGPFTHNLDAYSPRCVPCHKLLDLAYTNTDALVI